MWEIIKNYALYADTDRESYEGIKSRIEHSNCITATIFAVTATVLIGVMLLLSFWEEGFAASRPVYVGGIVFSLIQIVVAVASKKLSALTYVSVYMAVSVFLLYGIAIATLTRPKEQTVTFMVMLIFVPLIFVDRPLRMAVSLIFYIVLFIVLAHLTKSGSVLSVDVTDAVIFGLLSLVSETVVYRAKIRGYVLENRLHVMSETDQLTGLNNRNCYEWRLRSYAASYTDSFSCVYVDVNGLHELNNRKGHKAGDEMLREIADIVSGLFGRRDTYRIGGDEYVAFVTDKTEEEVCEKVAEMRKQIAARGYHAAVGYEFCNTKNADVNRVIVMAETRMYQDKADYYKSHDRRTR